MPVCLWGKENTKSNREQNCSRRRTRKVHTLYIDHTHILSFIFTQVPLINNLWFLFSLIINTVTLAYMRRLYHPLWPVTNPVTCVDYKKCLEKNYLFSFQQSIFNLRCSRAYSKSRVLQAVWKKGFFYPICSTSRSLTTSEMEEWGDPFGVALGRSFYKKSWGIKWAGKKSTFLH